MCVKLFLGDLNPDSSLPHPTKHLYLWSDHRTKGHGGFTGFDINKIYWKFIVLSRICFDAPMYPCLYHQ